jgi:arabinogalactan oligomer/maltooligosaccharide transport system permease protein
MTLRERLYPYLYILPATIFVGLIVLFPTIYSIYLAFTNYSLYHFQSFDFVGLSNFKKILFSSEVSTFLSVFWWTCIWAIASVALQFGVGLIFALILNRSNLAGRNIYRTFLIVPWAVPSFITILMWAGLLNTDYGAINQALITLPGVLPLMKGFLGVINFFLHLANSAAALFQGGGAARPPFEYMQLNARGMVPWLAEAPWARISVLIVNIWLGFPYMMSISLGALQSIPGELFEASSLDGASKWQQFKKITIPMLRSSVIPVLVTSFAFNFNNFVGIYLLTAGGPALAGSVAGATDILVSYTYKLAFTLSQYGMACAYGVLIFLLIGSLSAVNFKITGAFDEK